MATGGSDVDRMPRADAIGYASVPPQRGGSARAVMLGALIALGVQLWLLTDSRLVRPIGFLVAVGVALLAAMTPVARRALLITSGWLDRRGRVATPIRFGGVSLAAGVLLYAAAASSHRPFAPAVQDEFSYLLQTRMFAEGHLWLPAHPLAEFFDTFYVVTDRAYASQYFPGAALLYAPGIWLGLPFWAMPLATAAAACGAIFLLMRELFDGVVGVASVLAACGVLGLRYVSISVYAQQPTLFFGTLALWSLLRWDATRRGGFLIGAGVAIGWCAITRPLDAAAFALCGAAFVAWRLRRSPIAEWRRAALLGLLPLLPFAALQLTIDRGVTGRWLQTPFAYYAERDMPGTQLGFPRFDPTIRPVSPLPQKQAFYDSRVVPAARGHTFLATLADWRSHLFQNLVTELFADGLLVILIPAAALALGTKRAAVAAVPPVWWALYLLHPFTFYHYYVVLIPSSLVLTFAGVDALARGGPRRVRSIVRGAGPLLVATASVLALPQFRLDLIDQAAANPAEVTIRRLIASAHEPRLIVMCRYDPRSSTETEPVYNIDRARIDDNPAIRAHDLGDRRNAVLYRYYAERQPDRVVYRFDRGDGSFVRLGRVVDLAATNPR